MDAVVLRTVAAVGIDAAAGDDCHIGIFSDVKIIVDQVLDTAVRDQRGDVDLFAFGVVLDDDIDARAVRLGFDADVFCILPSGTFRIFADIKSRFRRFALPIGDQFQ